MSSERHARLRAQYPDVPPAIFELLDELRDTHERLGELRSQLARLVGWHERDGVIPVAKVAVLIDSMTCANRGGSGSIPRDERAHAARAFTTRPRAAR